MSQEELGKNEEILEETSSAELSQSETADVVDSNEDTTRQKVGQRQKKQRQWQRNTCEQKTMTLNQLIPVMTDISAVIHHDDDEEGRTG